VIGLSYLLGHTALTDDQSGMLGRINLASTSLLSVINDILDLSKIEAGRIEIVRENVALVPLDQLGMAINPATRRGQHQLHIHIGKLKAGYRDAIEKVPHDDAFHNVTIAGKLTVNGGLTSFVVKNGENEFSYNGDADVILRSKGRPDKQGKFGGRALVQDTGNILAINYAGDFTGGVRIDGKVSTPSSRVFKEDIKELSDREATEILSGLKPVQFRARKDPERSIQLGFIAEEVPEVVANPRRDAIYGAHIVATLTKVVKQHQEEIARLTAKLDHLTARGQAE